MRVPTKQEQYFWGLGAYLARASGASVPFDPGLRPTADDGLRHAMHELAKRAEQGCVSSQIVVAVMYASGGFAELDRDRAIPWVRKSWAMPLSTRCDAVTDQGPRVRCA